MKDLSPSQSVVFSKWDEIYLTYTKQKNKKHKHYLKAPKFPRFSKGNLWFFVCNEEKREMQEK